MNAIEIQARSIFLTAVEHAPDEWSAFLDEACGTNLELRARVEHLLQAHQAMGSIHGAGGDALVVTVDDPISERPGTVLGPYKLMEQIGEGGMGLVFVAEQQHPVRRKVALKVIKPGMDSRQVIARFEAERQALALMDLCHRTMGPRPPARHPAAVLGPSRRRRPRRYAGHGGRHRRDQLPKVGRPDAGGATAVPGLRGQDR
jgi:hypothetical protein